MVKKWAFAFLITVLSVACTLNVFADFDTLKPSQPADFKAVLNNDGSVSLTWTDALYADGYIIEKSADAAEGYITIASKLVGNEYLDLDSDGCRYYRITPYNENGHGPKSKTTAGAGLKKDIVLESGINFTAAVSSGNYIYAIGVEENIITVFEAREDEIIAVNSIKNDGFTPNAAYLSGDYIYISAKIPKGGNTLLIYSIKDRENPSFVRAVSTASVSRFCESGGYLFGAAGSSGVAVFDISKPEETYLYTYISVGGTVNACYIDDNKLYTATSGGELECYNITNFKTAFNYNNSLIYNFNTYLWQLTYADNWTGERGGYLRTYSHVADIKDLIVRDGIVYAASAFGIKISDFSSYKKPEYITPMDNTVRADLSGLKLVADGDLLYSVGTKNIRVYNIENSKEAVKAGIYMPAQESEIADMCLLENKIAVVNKNGLITIYNK